MTKAQQKRNEARVNKLYKEGCHGVQVNIFDLSKIMKVGQQGIEEGLDDTALKAKIVAFVETIRVN